MRIRYRLFTPVLFVILSVLLVACDDSYLDDPLLDNEPYIIEGEPPCFPNEVYNPQSDTCTIELPCETLRECEEMADAYFEEIDDYLDTEESCLADEAWDPTDEVCYAVCEEDDDCPPLDEELVGLFEDLGINTYVEGVVSFGTGVLNDLLGAAEADIVTYEVRGNDLVNPSYSSDLGDEYLDYRNDAETHQKIWSYFTSLIPQENRQNLSKFVIFTDGVDNVMAAVSPDYDDDPANWVLAVDIVDAEDPTELTYSLIHEYGHVMTLNNQQVAMNPDLIYLQDGDPEYEEAEAACATFFTGYEGCSYDSSYINVYFNRFWVDIYPEWVGVSEEDYAILDDLYYQYQDQFVSDYAATNVAEDIAESWTHFVLYDRPAGTTIAEEKMLFFYDYPELSRLRQLIQGRITTRLRRQSTQ